VRREFDRGQVGGGLAGTLGALLKVGPGVEDQHLLGTAVAPHDPCGHRLSDSGPNHGLGGSGEMEGDDREALLAPDFLAE